MLEATKESKVAELWEKRQEADAVTVWLEVFKETSNIHKECGCDRTDEDVSGKVALDFQKYFQTWKTQRAECWK